MSKGNPAIKVRFPPATIEAIKEVIARLNKTRFDSPMTVTDFVQAAVKRRLKETNRKVKFHEERKTQKIDNGPPLPPDGGPHQPENGTIVF